MQNNPLPRFRCWVICNVIGQVIVLIETIILKVKNCRFSDVWSWYIFRMMESMRCVILSFRLLVTIWVSDPLFTFIMRRRGWWRWGGGGRRWVIVLVPGKFRWPMWTMFKLEPKCSLYDYFRSLIVILFI